MPQTTKPAYSPRSTTGFFCPYCGKAITPSQRASYPPSAIGQFAPVYRCGCGKAIGEPVNMLVTRKTST